MQYVKKEGTEGIAKALASGEADLNGHFAAPLIIRLEAGDPIVILTGLHVGCFQLFGTECVRTIHDLKGKTVAVSISCRCVHANLIWRLRRRSKRLVPCEGLLSTSARSVYCAVNAAVSYRCRAAWPSRRFPSKAQ